MTTVDRSDHTLLLRPHWAQYCIKERPWLFICIVMLIGFRMNWLLIGEAFLLIAAFILTFLICQGIAVARVRYFITDEQIIYRHGILHRETDFMELYRVIDYQEDRTFMQQIAGLKTVIIFSTDRSTPRLNIIGQRSGFDLISEIRWRVEMNKQRKGIHEITNR